MGRTPAWWKKRHSRSNSSGGDLTLPSAPMDTSCAAHVKLERFPSESSEGSLPSHQLKKVRSNLSASSSSSTSERSDESTEVVEEQRHVDECSNHPEPPLVDDVITEHQSTEADGNNGVTSPEKPSESAAEENQSSPGDDGDVLDKPTHRSRRVHIDAIGEETPSIERTGTEDSGEGSMDSSAADTQGSSAQATLAMSVTTSKTDCTDYTDDGILRDDEGNPVDLAEAEENMLRDDEGNIIDPKTLVTRESFLDLCDEYCEDHIHTLGADNAQDESEIDEDTYVRFTIEAIVSEMITHIEGNDQSNLNSETCNEEDYEEPLKEGCNKEASANEIDEADENEDPNEADDNVEPTLGRGLKPKRNGNASGRNRSRQIRWGRACPQQGADDTVHIMFNNTLSTLDEEASCIIDEDSAEETEDEKSNMSHKSTRSEKFFKARWNYSLQVMRSEASTAQLIDARDEIDDMIRPKFVPDDRSVCSDEGTI